MAMEVAVRNGWRGVNMQTPMVRELSAQLRNAAIHPASERPADFRSPGSVGLKVNNLRAGGPHTQGTGLRSTAVERRIIALYADDTEALFARANHIRNKFGLPPLTRLVD